MKTSIFLAIVALATTATAAGVTTTVSTPSKTRAEDALLADVNGDGRDDLVVSVTAGERDFARSLVVHLRREDPVSFAPEPDHVLDLTPDVVAFAAGDVTEAPGSEIVLFTATGAFAWRAGAGERERPRKLLEADFLWQLPHPRETFVWSAGLRDLDGDGRIDLLVPEPGGYRVALQTRPVGKASRFDRTATLRLPGGGAGQKDPVSIGFDRRRSRERWRKIRVGLSLGVSDRDSDASALSVHDAVPCPGLVDWDADGRRDVLAMTSDELLVWRHGEDGTFRLIRQASPLTVDRGRMFDVAFGAHVADLDGDRRTDAVILAGDRRSEKPRTQVLVYTRRGGGRAKRTDAAPLFGPRGLPDQVLLIGGLTGATDLVDVDGNGRPDLVVGTLRVDLVDMLRSASSGTLDTRIYVYLNREGRFSKKPDLELTVPIPAKEMRYFRRRLAVRFIGDVSGNRVRDILVRDRGNRIRVLAVRRTRKGLATGQKSLFEMTVEDGAEVLVHRPGAGPPELLVVENERVHHVRFR